MNVLEIERWTYIVLGSTELQWVTWQCSVIETLTEHNDNKLLESHCIVSTIFWLHRFSPCIYSYNYIYSSCDLYCGFVDCSSMHISNGESVAKQFFCMNFHIQLHKVLFLELGLKQYLVDLHSLDQLRKWTQEVLYVYCNLFEADVQR